MCSVVLLVLCWCDGCYNVTNLLIWFGLAFEFVVFSWVYLCCFARLKC